MNNPFDYRPDKVSEEAFVKLITHIENLKKSRKTADINFVRELEAGKMLGVLIATDDKGEAHTLYAFSGQLGEGGFHFPGFVGPVFDYLHPDCYFKKEEAEISRLNREIEKFESDTLPKVKAAYDREKIPLDDIVERYKETCRVSKAAREEKRLSGRISSEEEAAMIRQSQFEKAEMRRLKKRLAKQLEPFTARLNATKLDLEAMKKKRRNASEHLQNRLFTDFKVLNVLGETKSLKEIFSDSPYGVPPSGAGECCGPKLLQEAFRRRLTPVSIAEYWYGRPKDGEVRIHGMHYPACRGKCLPVLSWMIQGLNVSPPLVEKSRNEMVFEPEIVFENQWFCVVEKPSGMLSVPGIDSAVSLEEWLRIHYGTEKDVKLAHRLDQDTSGLVIASFGGLSLKVLRMLFARRMVKKTYEAELEGDYKALGRPERGIIRLPLGPDYLDRPRQRIDFERGKEASSRYEFMDVKNGRSRVFFYPQTGRTHQLRVHAASEKGLGMPIVGDRLYGIKSSEKPGRLRLHAQKLEFSFPIDGRDYKFESTETPFAK